MFELLLGLIEILLFLVLTVLVVAFFAWAAYGAVRVFAFVIKYYADRVRRLFKAQSPGRPADPRQ